MNRSTTFFERMQYRLVRETLLLALVLTVPIWLIAVWGLGFSNRIGWAILFAGAAYLPLIFFLEAKNATRLSLAIIVLQWVSITLGILVLGVWGNTTLLTALVLHSVAAYLLVGPQKSRFFTAGHIVLTLMAWLNYFWQRPFLPPYPLIGLGSPVEAEPLYFGIVFVHLYLIIRGLLLSIRFTQQTVNQLAIVNRQLYTNEQLLRAVVEERTRKLAESEEKNRAMVEALPDAMSRVTAEGVYIDFRVPNDFPLRDKIDLDRVGRSFSDFAAPELANEFLASIRQAIKSGKRVTYRRTLPRLGATIEGRVAKVGDNEAISIIRDITSQVEAEKRLKESEARYRAFVAACPDVLIRLDKDGYYLDYWIPEEYSDIEILSTERSGRHLSEFVSEAVLTTALAKIEAALATGKMQIFDYDHPELERHLEARIVPDDEGAVTAMIRDISQQREELKRLQAVINAVPNAVIVFNKADPSEILWANQMACRYLERSLDQLIGLTIRDFVEFVDPSVLSSIMAQLRVGEPIQHLEAQIVVRQTESIWCRLSIVEMQYAGEPARMAFVEDIDELRRTAAVLQRVQKLDSLGVLAGGIAHDFNNLLTSIITQTAIAQHKLTMRQDPAPHLEKSMSASELAAELIQKMLAFSGKGQTESRQISLNELVTSNISLFEAMLPRHLTFSVKEENTTLFVDADGAQIQQVLMNLLLNAAQAFEGRNEGAIVLRLAKRWFEGGILQEGNTAVSLQAGPYASIMITDNGVGMSKLTLQKIFEPFFTTKSAGHGLGLAAVVGIMRGHGGEIVVQSQPNIGTTFELLLPLASNSLAEPHDQPVRHLQKDTHKKHVLVIDDEPNVLESIRDMLQFSQNTVLDASGGKLGLQKYLEHQSDIGVVILDLSMPDMHGSEVFLELRKHDKYLPVILCSGYSEADVAYPFASEEQTYFLQKPFKTETLRDLVNKLIE